MVTLDELITRERAVIGALLDKRKALTDRLVELRAADTLDEATVNSAIAERDAVDPAIEAAQQRLAGLEAEQLRDAAAAELAARFGAPEVSQVRVTSEPEIYTRDGRHSYFRDLFAAQTKGDRAAVDRLSRNDRAVQARAIGTTDGGIGEFVPPAWITDDYERLARPGRVTADLLTRRGMPGGTDSISLPLVTGGSSTAEQTQGNALSETDMQSSSTTAAVATVGGVQTVNVQLIEQSPFNIDSIVLGDLAADYAARIGAFVINNNAANKRGLLNVSGINSVTYTDATPTFPELWPKLIDAQLQVHTGRYLPATHIVMHPRRWAWFQAQLDSAGRPYASSDIDFPLLANVNGSVPEGFAGTIRGSQLPVFLDPGVPTNLGAGTNEDRIIVFRPADSVLFESTPKAEVFREPLAKNLQVVYRLYSYVALLNARAPKSISVIGGTGLVAPTF